MPKILSAIFAIAVLVGSIGVSKSLVKFLIFAVSIVFLVTLLNFLHIKKTAQRREDYWRVVLPSFFLMGLFGTLAVVSSIAVKLVLAIVGVGVFYHYEANFPADTPSIDEETFTLSATALVLISLWAGNFFFRPPWWVMSVLFVFAFFMILNQAFYKMRVQRRLLWTAVAALILAEVGISVLYWPVNFLTSAVVVFGAFYLIYILTKLYYAHRLTKKRVYFHVALTLILVLGSLASSSWAP